MSDDYEIYNSVAYHTRINNNLTRKITQVTNAHKLANSNEASGTIEITHDNKKISVRDLNEKELNKIFNIKRNKSENKFEKLKIGSEKLNYMILDN